MTDRMAAVLKVIVLMAAVAGCAGTPEATSVDGASSGKTSVDVPSPDDEHDRVAAAQSSENEDSGNKEKGPDPGLAYTTAARYRTEHTPPFPVVEETDASRESAVEPSLAIVFPESRSRRIVSLEEPSQSERIGE